MAQPSHRPWVSCTNSAGSLPTAASSGCPFVIGIGTDRADPAPLLELLAAWHPSGGEAVLVQTRMDGFAAAELEHDMRSGLLGAAAFAEHCQVVREGMVLIAPPRMAMRLVGDEVQLARIASEGAVLDGFFYSLCSVVGAASAAVLLATQQLDGLLGLLEVARSGGVALAHRLAIPDPMMQEIEPFARVLPEAQLISRLSELASDRRVPGDPPGAGTRRH
jgi:chemotaxis response regulator CheB